MEEQGLAGEAFPFNPVPPSGISLLPLDSGLNLALPKSQCDTLLIHWTHTGVSRVPGAHLSGDQAVVLGLYALATLTQFRTRLLEKSSVPKGPGETLHFGRCDYQMDVKLHCAWHL